MAACSPEVMQMVTKALPVQLCEAQTQALQQIDKKSADWRARERARTLLLLNQGKSAAEVALLQDITARTVHNTWARWLSQGMAALTDKPRRGAPRKLDPVAVQRLTQWASQEPLTAVQLLERHGQAQGTPVHINTLVSALKREGFVWKRTRHSLKKSETTVRSNEQAKKSMP